MTTTLALLLLVLTIPVLLINLYFTLLLLGRWPGLRDSLGALFRTCGADTSSCAIVCGRRMPDCSVAHRTFTSVSHGIWPYSASPSRGCSRAGSRCRGHF